MIKKILVLIFVSIFLNSCGGSDDPVVTSGLTKQETANISIEVPSSWYVISDKENILPKAKDGEIELAVSSDSVVNGFANNLLILSDDLQTYVTSSEFSMLNNIGAQTDYLDYTELDSKEFTYLDEEKSVLYTFEAKYNLDTPKLKFLQTAHICDQNKAYFLTLALPTTVKDTSKYEEFMATFACK
ncbi:MAG: hypothetical protein PHS49_03635 [Candidatus Gracilibacteria bacterium]|nr:hypothetical protein [Candidatus Gracilibacteria bacterium]